MSRNAPSIKRLCEFKDVTPELAKRIRYLWKEASRKEILSVLAPLKLHYYPTTWRGRMMAINLVAEYYGVEYLGRNKNGEGVYYLNAGDTYTDTIMFINSRMILSSWGQLVESGYIRKEKPE